MLSSWWKWETKKTFKNLAYVLKRYSAENPTHYRHKCISLRRHLYKLIRLQYVFLLLHCYLEFIGIETFTKLLGKFQSGLRKAFQSWESCNSMWTDWVWGCVTIRLRDTHQCRRLLCCKLSITKPKVTSQHKKIDKSNLWLPDHHYSFRQQTGTLKHFDLCILKELIN